MGAAGGRRCRDKGGRALRPQPCSSCQEAHVQHRQEPASGLALGRRQGLCAPRAACGLPACSGQSTNCRGALHGVPPVPTCEDSQRSVPRAPFGLCHEPTALGRNAMSFTSCSMLARPACCGSVAAAPAALPQACGSQPPTSQPCGSSVEAQCGAYNEASPRAKGLDIRCHMAQGKGRRVAREYSGQGGAQKGMAGAGGAGRGRLENCRASKGMRRYGGQEKGIKVHTRRGSGMKK